MKPPGRSTTRMGVVYRRPERRPVCSITAKMLLRCRLASITAWSPRRIPAAMRGRRATAATNAAASTAPSGVAHVRLLLVALDLKHALTQAVGCRFHQPPGPSFDQKSRDWYGQIHGQLEADPGGIAFGRQRVAALLRALLFGARQRPAHPVVVNGIVEHLFIADAHDFDRLPRFARMALLVPLQDFDLFVNRGPLG